MSETTSCEIYWNWKSKHWNPRTQHTPTKIQSAVFKRIQESGKRLVDIIDKPNDADVEKAKAIYGGSCEFEAVREAGKKVLLVWAEQDRKIM